MALPFTFRDGLGSVLKVMYLVLWTLMRRPTCSACFAVASSCDSPR